MTTKTYQEEQDENNKQVILEKMLARNDFLTVTDLLRALRFKRYGAEGLQKRILEPLIAEGFISRTFAGNGKARYVLQPKGKAHILKLLQKPEDETFVPQVASAPRNVNYYVPYKPEKWATR